MPLEPFQRSTLPFYVYFVSRFARVTACKPSKDFRRLELASGFRFWIGFPRYAFAVSGWDQMIQEDVFLKNTLAMKPEDIYHADPGILGGTPVFTETRVPVDSLIAHLKAGDLLAEFLVGFPTVRRKQAEAFLELALKEALEVTPHKEPA